VFNTDISKLKWRDYSRNFGYGIKHYILHEQAVVPSLGYGDAVMKMERSRSYWPFGTAGKAILNVKSVEEMKKILLATESVKEAMAQIVAEKLKFYQGTL